MKSPSVAQSRISWTVLPVLIALLMSLAACGLIPETYRYRMTVEVNTPNGVRSGSSVIEESTQENPGFPGPEAGGITGKTRGEAVAVDLGGKTLFALLRSVNNGKPVGPWALVADDPRVENEPDWRKRTKILKQAKGKADMQPENYPMLVTFRDIGNPVTVEQVDPANLAATFGPGYSLRRITVEITDEPVTYRIREILPWLKDVSGPRLHPDPPNPDLETVEHYDFLRSE